MGLISKRTRFTVGGVKVVVRPLSQDVGFWRRYGCVVILRARKKKRANVRVRICNTYFARIDTGTGFTLEGVLTEGTESTGKRRTRLSKFKLFLGVQGEFDQTQVRVTGPLPGDPGEWVKIVGVTSYIRVDNGGDSEESVVSAGDTVELTAIGWTPDCR